MGWILGRLQEEFKHHHTLHINLEQMTGPTVGQTIQGADGAKLKAAMDDLPLPLAMNMMTNFPRLLNISRTNAILMASIFSE
jgi:hypothetical protein